MMLSVPLMGVVKTIIGSDDYVRADNKSCANSDEMLPPKRATPTITTVALRTSCIYLAGNSYFEKSIFWEIHLF